MTRVADQHGNVVGATVLEVQPNAVTALRTVERDGYAAIQLGAGDPKHAKKPQQGQLSKANAKAGAVLREFRTDESLELGSEMTVDVFAPGDIVNVTATSKGRGFAGTIKRHHFAQGPRSHGGMNVREPGSIGAQRPQRVVKGRRMAGRLGGDRTTVKHLEVLDVLPDQHLLVIRGAVPGIRGAQVVVTASPRHAAAPKKGDE
ncbi:50S ribosomal protein L3 [Candidatus Berkelbacteria bacterium]|nr:50S ribosomal protein L3 [Candidatus Berkelbacteria bacterium]